MVDISATILFQWINFGILLFLMIVLAYRPILDFMDRRRREIGDTLEEAEGAKREAEQTLAEYRRRLAAAEGEARGLLAEARTRGDKERARILAQAQDEARSLQDRARQNIELEERNVRRRLQEDTVGISMAAAGRLLGRELTGRDQRHFVEESIRELEKNHG